MTRFVVYDRIKNVMRCSACGAAIGYLPEPPDLDELDFTESALGIPVIKPQVEEDWQRQVEWEERWALDNHICGGEAWDPKA